MTENMKYYTPSPSRIAICISCRWLLWELSDMAHAIVSKFMDARCREKLDRRPLPRQKDATGVCERRPEQGRGRQ